MKKNIMNQKYKQKSRSLSLVLGSSREGIVKNSDTYIAANKDHNTSDWPHASAPRSKGLLVSNAFRRKSGLSKKGFKIS